MNLSNKVKYQQFKIKAKRISFILFIWILGIITGVTFYFAITQWKETTTPRIIEINVAHADEVKPLVQEVVSTPQIVAEVAPNVDEIAETIYTKESSRGANNYSKCAAIGKVNNIGFGIPGNGTYQCFKNHADEMTALRGWIVDKLARGMSEKDLMCLYSGKNYSICK